MCNTAQCIPCSVLYRKLLVSRLEKAQKLQRESIVMLEQLMCNSMLTLLCRGDIARAQYYRSPDLGVKAQHV